MAVSVSRGFQSTAQTCEDLWIGPWATCAVLRTSRDEERLVLDVEKALVRDALIKANSVNKVNVNAETLSTFAIFQMLI